MKNIEMQPIKLYTMKDLPDISKAEIFKSLGCTFDYALPQGWLDDFCKYHSRFSYNLVLSTTVWAYPPAGAFHLMGVPVSCCLEIHNVIMDEFWNKLVLIDEQ